MSSTSPSFNLPSASFGSWPNWGAFHPQSSASSAPSGNNSQLSSQHVSGNAPYIFIPVPMSLPQASESTKPSSYHVSFINNDHALNVRLVNNKAHTITTNMIGKGTKFECDIPIDQSVDIIVTVLTDTPPENLGIVAQVDNDPFGLRKAGLR